MQIQNTIYAITAHTGIYLNCHWALVLKLHQLPYMSNWSGQIFGYSKFCHAVPPHNI